MSEANHLILFGAGASYGSETERSVRPPLASDLFDELSQFEPILWQKVPSDIANIYRIDFEEGMLALADRMPHALPVRQRSMGAFFYRYGPTLSSLYVKLARQIKLAKWSGAIATLNYERMLQLALNREGCTFVCGEAEANRVEVCFPHGCCNLFCDSVRAVADAVSMMGMNVTTNGPVSCVDHPDAFWHRIRTDAFPPVMSYFEPKKFTTSGASFIEAQRHRLTELIVNAKTIVVIGVQVREQDKHVWNALASTNAPIYYCSGSRGASAYTDWQSRIHHNKRKNDFVAVDYWSDNFDAINIHAGIE